MKKTIIALLSIILAILFYVAGLSTTVLVEKNLPYIDNCLLVYGIDDRGEIYRALYFIDSFKEEDGVLIFNILPNAFIMGGMNFDLTLNSETNQLVLSANYPPTLRKDVFKGQKSQWYIEEYIAGFLELEHTTDTDQDFEEFLVIRGKYSKEGISKLTWRLLSLYEDLIM